MKIECTLSPNFIQYMYLQSPNFIQNVYILSPIFIWYLQTSGLSWLSWAASIVCNTDSLGLALSHLLLFLQPRLFKNSNTTVLIFLPKWLIYTITQHSETMVDCRFMSYCENRGILHLIIWLQVASCKWVIMIHVLIKIPGCRRFFDNGHPLWFFDDLCELRATGPCPTNQWSLLGRL